MAYKHGAYGEMQATQGNLPQTATGTLPVYIGRLPVHQLMDYSGKVNQPILVSSYTDAVAKVGYSDTNWADYDLCEAIYAHFNNSIKPIGPIILINVLDPDTMKNTGGTASVTLVGGQGTITDDKVILKTVAITGKVLGTDFTAYYSTDGASVVIKDLTGTLTSPVTVNFSTVDPTDVTKTEVIGGTNATTGAKTGIYAVDLVYRVHNMVPTILCSPGWSNVPDVDGALKAVSQKINGHFYAWVNSDLIATSTANTIAKAKTWKTANNYIGAGEAPCWPLAKKGTKLFHLSTLATVTMQWVDLENDGIPYETPSNKQIDITSLVLADGTELFYDQQQANELNTKGIRTATYWGGKWVLWGPHTGAYEYGADIDPKDKFDCNVRMMYFILNEFQTRYGIEVDKPMSRSRKDTILNDYQERIDGLVTRGALLYGKIEFLQTNNPTSDIVEGDFTFNISTTTTPPGKSLTAKLQYTTKGIDIAFGGES